MRYPLLRLVLFIGASLVPAYWLYQAWIFALGPDPGKVLLLNLGQGALILLLASLAMTPLQKITGWSGWIVMRRQIGLWAFAYALLHLFCYLFFVLGFEWGRFGTELAKRPYILVGALALLLLLPLVVTSNRLSMRRLGARWKRLHRLVYAVLALALLHMLWIVRSDIGQWTLYAGLAVLLMALRWSPVSACLSRLRRKA